MTQKELVTATAVTFDKPSAEVESLLKYVFWRIGNELVKGGKVQLNGFGTFAVKKYSGRKVRDPFFGKQHEIPARNFPIFRAAKKLKEAVIQNVD